MFLKGLQSIFYLTVCLSFQVSNSTKHQQSLIFIAMKSSNILLTNFKSISIGFRITPQKDLSWPIIRLGKVYHFSPLMILSFLRRNSVEYWSSRYVRATTGSQLKQFFPSLFQVNSALPSISLTQFNSMILTGHRLLRSHMFKVELTDDPICKRQKEDIDHFIFH